LHIITPCIIAAAFCLLVIIDGFTEMNKSQGWSMLAVYIFAPLFFGLLIAHFIIKKIAKENTLALWLSEIVLIVIVIISFNIYRP
jgi:predicted Na+-dependent transporter